jgi:hypothetical protein
MSRPNNRNNSLETSLRNLLNEHSRPRTNSFNTNTQTGGNVGLNNIHELRVRNMRLIDDLSYDYFQNMELYQNNVRDIISVIRGNLEPRQDQRQEINNTPIRPSNTPIRPSNTPIRPSNTPIRPSNTPIRPSNTRAAEQIFSYFFYPLTETDVNNNIVQNQVDASYNTIHTYIGNATQTIAYNPYTTTIVNCPISLDDFQSDEIVTQIRHCGHIFRTQPLMNWLNRNNRCPVCRYDIRNYIQDTTQDISNNNQDTTQDISNNNQDTTQDTYEQTQSINTFNNSSTFNSLFRESFNNELLNIFDSILENPNSMSYNSYIYSYDASGNVI